MGFLTETEPPRGPPLGVLPGIRRIVAANPGPMTYHGTNTYLIDGPEGVGGAGLGPDRPEHIEAILEATGEAISLILLSHTHLDHVGAVPGLSRQPGRRSRLSRSVRSRFRTRYRTKRR